MQKCASFKWPWNIQQETFSLFSCFLFQSIRVTHESSAQEGQTEVSFWFLTLCCLKFFFFFFACFVLNLMHFNICFLSVVGPKFRRESESAFYSFCECWRALIWTGWVSHKAKMCLSKIFGRICHIVDGHYNHYNI